MWVDKGKEFYNKDVKDLIELYSTENEEKSSVVERWIRTMKEKMWKYFTASFSLYNSKETSRKFMLKSVA